MYSAIGVVTCGQIGGIQIPPYSNTQDISSFYDEVLLSVSWHSLEKCPSYLTSIYPLKLNRCTPISANQISLCCLSPATRDNMKTKLISPTTTTTTITVITSM